MRELWQLLEQKCAPGLVSSDSQQPQSISTKSQTPTTDSDTSVKTAIRESVGSLEFHFPEQVALDTAELALHQWEPSEEALECLSPTDWEVLSRIFADTLSRTAAAVAHEASSAVLEEVIRLDEVASTESGAGSLSIVAMSEQHRAQTTLVVLKQVDDLLVELCGELNSIADASDSDVSERVTDLRKKVISSDEVLRRHIVSQDWEADLRG